MNSKQTKELYEKYGFLIYGRCIRILCSEDDAKDAVQEIFMKLVNHIDKFKTNEHIIPWIYTVSKNHCFNVLRQRKKFVYMDNNEIIADKKSWEREYGNKELIKSILKLHSKRVQEAVYYTFIEGLNQKEIQKLTGQSPATIRRNLSRFKKSLPTIKKRFSIE